MDKQADDNNNKNILYKFFKKASKDKNDIQKNRGSRNPNIIGQKHFQIY